MRTPFSAEYPLPLTAESNTVGTLVIAIAICYLWSDVRGPVHTKVNPRDADKLGEHAPIVGARANQSQGALVPSSVTGLSALGTSRRPPHDRPMSRNLPGASTVIVVNTTVGVVQEVKAGQAIAAYLLPGGGTRA